MKMKGRDESALAKSEWKEKEMQLKTKNSALRSLRQDDDL